MNSGTRTGTRNKPPVKITPKPKFARQGVDFVELDNGAYFLYKDCLCIKLANEDQMGLDLNDKGQVFYGLCGEYVQPVDVEIKWTKK